MIIHKIKIKRVAGFETKDETQIAGESEAPIPGIVSPKGMETPAGKEAYLLNSRRRVQSREHVAELGHKV
jgi:hypothetical protein